MRFRRHFVALVMVSPILLLTMPAAAQTDAEQVADMIDDIKRDAQRSSDWLGTDQLDPAVLAALDRVPRHEFVPAEFRQQAYANRPLPIGHGQTISQPFIVALMTDLLDLQDDFRVLEVGTGSGYQAAVLAELCAEVFSIEIVPELADEAAATLSRLGYGNVTVRAGDGYGGWPEQAPFDAIMVTAGASHVPPALLDQLKPGARMVIPVGNPRGGQELVLVTRDADGGIERREVIPVLFVPLTGGHD